MVPSSKKGVGLFRHLTFQQETFWHGHFLTRTFRHEGISAQEHFGMGTFRHHGTFGHGEITTLGHFGTRIFRHMDILAQGHL